MIEYLGDLQKEYILNIVEKEFKECYDLFIKSDGAKCLEYQCKLWYLTDIYTKLGGLENALQRLPK